MFKFILKGILRDRSRSLLPIIIITIGVTLTVLLSGYLRGVMGDLTDQNARFQTGHVKVVTKAYRENMDQLPLDLAILGVDSLQAALEQAYPSLQWVERTNFGGLIDVPDENGETKGQGPAAGMAVQLFDQSSGEIERMNILASLVSGTVPTNPGEAIIAAEFAEKLDVKIGDEVTYVGSTMNGSMSFKGFVVTGLIRFGTASLDKGAIIIDISDAQNMLDMYDGSTEILGYLDDAVYVDEKATDTADDFNQKTNQEDEYAPVMLTLKEQNNLASYLDMVDVYSGLFVGIFVFAMSLVLWNTGLLGGLRRYQEFGIRLALGESKGQIYSRMVLEAIIIGAIGSLIGTAIGLALTFYLQYNGIDISGMVDGGTMMMPSIIRAKYTPNLLYLGFIPGLFAMVIGTMLSGIGIYKRQTAVLFKELEV
ncbi:FtsX-like permease family protein [Algoriphagus sp.]|uniref:ABC transporter permease n=1 Tax=Algoriphagus sp. TaxID=1872435 RepID=UPI00326EC20A